MLLKDRGGGEEKERGRERRCGKREQKVDGWRKRGLCNVYLIPYPSSRRVPSDAWP